jgi:hypothetical protein
MAKLLHMQLCPNYHIFQIKSMIYGEVIKVDNQLEKFDSSVQPDVMLIWEKYHI